MPILKLYPGSYLTVTRGNIPRRNLHDLDVPRRDTMSTQSEVLHTGTQLHQRAERAGFETRRSRRDSLSDNGVERFATALGWFSIGLGLAELLMPKKLGSLIGVSDHQSLM